MSAGPLVANKETGLSVAFTQPRTAGCDWPVWLGSAAALTGMHRGANVRKKSKRDRTGLTIGVSDAALSFA